ncbi:hypothetical protein FRB95_013313 [Tulasnella sp. JGI-2019a]|nr:hypothetical protein FRB95_013313 [Tulasnella sp. JGI-2019a]
MRLLTVCLFFFFFFFNYQIRRCLASCFRLASVLLQDPEMESDFETQNHFVTFPHLKILLIDTFDWRDLESTRSSLRCTTIPVLENLEVMFPEPKIVVADATRSEVQAFMYRSPLSKEALVNGRVIRKE